MEINAETEYKNRLETYTTELVENENIHQNIGRLRLLLVAITILLSSLCYNNNYISLSFISISIGTILFVLLARKHLAIERRIAQLQKLATINRNGIERTNGGWRNFQDNGSEFFNEEHAFSQDLDIFGDSSIFQRINTTHTSFGREKLASKLCNTDVPTIGISETQRSIAELSNHIEFRQAIELSTLQTESRFINKVLDWFNSKNTALSLLNVKRVVHALPVISIILSCAEIIFYQTFFAPVGLYSLQVLLVVRYNKQNQKLFNAFDNKRNTLKQYANVLEIIEAQTFATRLLQNLQASIIRNNTPSTSLHSLNEILNSAGLRHNKLVHLFINIILLWDTRCAIQAIEWKKENGASIRIWFDVIGEIEALASLSVLSYENPSWTMPTINNSKTIDAKNIKHPLLEEDTNIGNDFSLGHNKDTAIISGSNMSGKSTFLRTVATNLVLAHAGAPVNADSFHCGQFTIVTSMRTVDNIDKQISTFYAELIRIKKMIDVAKTSNTFFFIDEIFSGTNSRDRLEGAFQVIKALNTPNCIGIISTHDLALCELTTTDIPTAKNYHFREYYQGDKIHFDYKIHAGQSTTSNALFMMQKIGIPVNQS